MMRTSALRAKPRGGDVCFGPQIRGFVIEMRVAAPPRPDGLSAAGLNALVGTLLGEVAELKLGAPGAERGDRPHAAS